MQAEQSAQSAGRANALEDIAEAGEKALKAFAVQDPECLLLYRGEMAKETKEEMAGRLREKGLVSRALSFVTIAKELEAMLREGKIEELAERHMQGNITTVWNNGTPTTITLTPFISLTSNPKIALMASLSSLEIRKGLEIGMYTEEDGTPSNQFYGKMAELIDKEGYAPVVYVVKAQKSQVLDLQQAKGLEPDKLGERIIRNGRNSYGEEEYIALHISPGEIIGLLVLIGNPFKGDNWFWQVLRNSEK